MEWIKEETPDNKFFKICYHTSGDIKKDTQYYIFEIDDQYLLKTRREISFLDASENWIGKFKDLSKAQLVAQMIDEG